jgi:putative phosphoribosyl transferase
MSSRINPNKALKMIVYNDRTEAGQVLAREMSRMNFETKPVVLAIPNGGIPVGVEIAKTLDAGLDAIIVRKLQVPGNTEAGFGALTSQGALLLNDRLVRSIGLNQHQIDIVVKRTQSQIDSRKEDYHGLIGIINPSGKDVILVDDGLASGYTMRAAVQSVRSVGPTSITVAVPTSSRSAADLVGAEVESLICPRIESGFIFAVANAYRNWYDVPDSEVIEILKAYRE